MENSPDGRVQLRLADGANHGEHYSQKVEFHGLASHEEKNAGEGYDNRMYANVCPASNSIHWGVFPSLQSVAVIEIMGRFPVVEDLIAILYRRIECGYKASE